MAASAKFAPVEVPQGMDLVSPDGAPALINVISGVLGLTPRPGTQELATNVGSPVGEVRSLLAYHGSQPSQNKLFAGAADGLYDVSAGGASPARALAFGTVTGSSGRGASVAVTTLADRFFLYADEDNGYFLRPESTGVWAAGSVTGVSPGALCFVTQFKNRVWFAEKNTSHAWYLGLGPSISGAATLFDFGNLFLHGGSLIGLWSWSITGGNGINDYLVACSTSGDVVVFQGTDPAVAASWSQVGDWFVGGFPVGRRVATPNGGDVQLLTLQGVLSLNQLSSGVLLSPQTYDTAKIRPRFTADMSAQGTLQGWEMQVHPTANILVVNEPGLPGSVHEQLAMSFATRGWSRLQGLDIHCSAVWQGQFYFGTGDGRVLQSTGFVDNVKLGGDTSQALAVQCTVLGGFKEQRATRKSVSLVQAHFTTHGLSPAFAALVRYDYDLSEPAPLTAAAFGSFGTNMVWDVFNWDEEFWADLVGVSSKQLGGAFGIGHAVAVGCQFAVQDYCVLASLDAQWTEGGFL